MKRYCALCMLLLGSTLFAQTSGDYNRSGVEKAKRGNVQDAMKDFDEAIRKANQASAKTYHNLGWAYEKKGEPEKALSYYEEAIERNPQQVPSLERACELYLDAEKYDSCIVVGERVLSLDPSNKNVIPWLEKAYMARFKIRNREISDREREALKKQALESMKNEQKKEPTRKVFSIGISATARSAWVGGNRDQFDYIKTPGLFNVNFPIWGFVELMPVDKWKISAKGGVPYYGALLPEVVNCTERFELSYLSDNVMLGAGVMGNHYRSDSVWGTKESFNDFKLGFLLAIYYPDSSVSFTFYPDLIPYDAGYKKNKTLDVSYSQLDYVKKINDKTKALFGFSTHGFTFYDHAAKVSNYAGVYAFSGGVEIAAAKNVSFRAEFIERCYMLDLMNERPYSFMNGQGFFGFNMYKWFKGAPMSGLDCYTSGLAFTLREKASPNVEFFQKLTGEMVPPSRHTHDITFEAGIEGGF